MGSSLFNRSLGRSESQKVSACQCNENADKLIEKLGEVNWGVKENWYPVMYKEKKKNFFPIFFLMPLFLGLYKKL